MAKDKMVVPEGYTATIMATGANGEQVELKLSQSDIKFINSIPLEQRQGLATVRLERKKAGYERAEKTRRIFRVYPSPKDNGIICVAGLGIRFPVSLRPDQWELLFTNAEAIKKAYTK